MLQQWIFIQLSVWFTLWMTFVLAAYSCCKKHFTRAVVRANLALGLSCLSHRVGRMGGIGNLCWIQDFNSKCYQFLTAVEKTLVHSLFCHVNMNSHGCNPNSRGTDSRALGDTLIFISVFNTPRALPALPLPLT